jgi:hypothetical protein
LGFRLLTRVYQRGGWLLVGLMHKLLLVLGVMSQLVLLRQTALLRGLRRYGLGPETSGGAEEANVYKKEAGQEEQKDEGASKAFEGA